MADLKIKIKGDSSSFDRSIAKAKSGLAAIGAIMGSALTGATFALGGMINGFNRLKEMVDPVAGKLDDVAKASRRIGISTSDFQELAFAARRTGVDTGVVEKAFKRLQKTIGDSGRGLSTAKDALAALGLSFEQLDGKMPMDQFRIVAGRLAAIEDVTKRNAIAQDVFGARAGLAITPLISEYDALAQRLRIMNGIMGDDAIKAAERYKDELENLQVVMDSLVASTGVIGVMADNFARLEATLTGLRRGTGALKELAGVLGRGTIADALSGNLDIISLTKNIAGGLGAVGSQEMAARQLFGGIQSLFKPRGGSAGGGGGGAIVGKMLAGGVLGGGGTFESLGGDISGGGYAARTTIAQEQLDTLKKINDGVDALKQAYSYGMTQEGITEYWRTEVKGLFD